MLSSCPIESISGLSSNFGFAHRIESGLTLNWSAMSLTVSPDWTVYLSTLSRMRLGVFVTGFGARKDAVVSPRVESSGKPLVSIGGCAETDRSSLGVLLLI